MAEDDPVQPEQGQGGESNDAPYAEYLNRVPEEVRGEIEPIFKEWDGNTTRRFQEAAEYKRGWEPFEQLGVNQRDPAEIEWAMQFVDSLDNPDAIKEWYSNYSQEKGLTQAEQQDLEQEYVDPSVESLVTQRLQAQLAPMSEELAALAEWRAQQDQASREAEAAASIRSELDDLKGKHPGEYNEEFIEMFIPRHMETDPGNAVQLAFQDAQRFRAQVEKETLQGKANTPHGGEAGGVADGSVEQPNTLEKAREVARQMLRANHA